MFCRNCGHEVNEKADVCVGCGVFIDNAPRKATSQKVAKTESSEGNPFARFVEKCNWIFAVASIVFLVNGILFPITGFYIQVYSSEYFSSFYLFVAPETIALMWVFLSLAQTLAIVSFIFALVAKKQLQLPILAFSLSLTLLVYAIIMSTVY